MGWMGWFKNQNGNRGFQPKPVLFGFGSFGLVPSLNKNVKCKMQTKAEYMMV